MDEALSDLAKAAGIAVEWEDAHGEPKTVAPEVLRRILGPLGLPADSKADIEASRASLREAAVGVLPPLVTGQVGCPTVLPLRGGPGRMRLTLEDGTGRDLEPEVEPDGRLRLPAIDKVGYHRLVVGDAQTVLAMAPARCLGLPELVGQRRLWGAAAQIYGLRRPGDGGFGDLTALAEFAETAAGQGADAVAISPLHALFAANPGRFGPYAPSSRLFYNVLHVDPAQAFGGGRLDDAIEATGVGAELAACEALDLVDWGRAGTAKLRLLRHLYDRMAGDTALTGELERFRRDGGDLLTGHAVFEALHAHLAGQEGGLRPWQAWSSDLHDPQGQRVREFAREHGAEIGFHVCLQWLADRGLAAAQRRAREAGMAVGLIADLAVGMDRGGSHAWSRPADVLEGLTIGAPPDLFNPQGQSWGLAAFSPRALASSGFEAFLATMRSAMRHAGGIRIDHIMGLTRLWLVPDGASPADGAYLRFPLTDMLRLIALESVRKGALVVGEDLGTVPDGFREQLDASGILGMRVLWFEREDEDSGPWTAPAQWSRDAAAMSTTHDLPTIAGWWQGRDIDWRVAVGGGSVDEAAQRQGREEDRTALWSAMVEAECAQGEAPTASETEPVVDAALSFVAKARSQLALVPLEDLAGLVEQPNLPGTIDEHPNWRRRLPLEAAELFATPAVAHRVAAIVGARGAAIEDTGAPDAGRQAAGSELAARRPADAAGPRPG